MTHEHQKMTTYNTPSQVEGRQHLFTAEWACRHDFTDIGEGIKAELAPYRGDVLVLILSHENLYDVEVLTPEKTMYARLLGAECYVSAVREGFDGKPEWKLHHRVLSEAELAAKSCPPGKDHITKKGEKLPC